MRALPRVLLVDDDAAIRRLVALALEDEAVQLISCADGEEALAVLSQAPVELLITDLMMPGLSGFELLERLRDDPALRGQARLVAFSAGINAQRAELLKALGVETLLDKPVSIARLLDCVRRCVPSADAAAPGALPAGFGGDQALYQAFLEACLAQYPQDLLDGDAALRRGDTGALCRVAHNLKGSLRTLGLEEMALLAWQVEQGAADVMPDSVSIEADWVNLRETLKRFVNKSAS